MSAFDTTSNTSSITFTNAWGTAVVHESAVNQRVLGFSRNDDKRYFELVVDGDGEDHTNLWMGAWDHYGTGGGGIVVGGASQRAIIASGANALVPGSTSPAFGATPGPGAVFGVAVNFSGDGTRLGGGATVPTASDGHGNLVLPVIYDYFRNNTFITSHVSWDWPSGGFPKRAEPFFLRLSNSASDAQVSLRVVTTSFAYAIPTGYIAWGDGPMGAATSVTATVSGYPLAWDPLKISGDISLSFSDRIAIKQTNPAGFVYWDVYSIPLPPFGGTTIGKRVFEVFLQGTEAHTPEFGFIDASAPADAFAANTTTDSRAYVYDRGGPYTRRGVAYTSITASLYLEQAAATEHSCRQYIINHDTGVFWATASPLPNIAAQWAGTSGAGLASPYTGVDGLTLTDSVGLRFLMHERRDFLFGQCEINSGHRSFVAYPLMPGVKSYDGARECLGTGDTWQTGVTSYSYAHGNLAVRTKTGLASIIQTTQAGAKSTGKWFFQVWYKDLGGVIGIRPTGRSSLGANQTYKGNIANNLTTTNPLVVRYSVTATGTYSATVGAIPSVHWGSVAVDFDAGEVWFGLVDTRLRANRWINGGDPATGLAPAATFTANTPMVAMTDVNSAAASGEYTIFVAEDSNVIDVPAGFIPWNGVAPTSLSASPTATASGASTSTGNIWPFGIVN